MHGYLAPTGFEDELIEELGSDVISVHGRLVLAKAQTRPPAWSHNIWLNPREIEISSIGEAAKVLRSLAPRWALESYHLHRRAALVQEKLPRVKQEPLDFPSPLPVRALGSWTLLANERLLASAECTSPFANGEMAFVGTRAAPSRAYLKLWELFTAHGVHPKAGERCVELGASPGGWTWVLASLGLDVIAVDRAPLAPSVAKMRGVRSLQGNAFTLDPESVGPIDWLFSDLICYPEQLERLIERWRASGMVKNLVCTVKFKGETDHQAARRLASIPGSQLRHLVHNKHELTWWLVT